MTTDPPYTTRPCNVLGELERGQLRAFVGDLPPTRRVDADFDSTVLKCELVREHTGAHGHCLGGVSDTEDYAREIWATWGPDIDAKPILWVTMLCPNEWCIFFDGHAGDCTKGHTA